MTNKKLSIDEIALRKLVIRVSDLADNGPMMEYISLFTENATWEMIGGDIIEGKDAIEAAAKDRWANKISGPDSPLRHIVLPLSLDIKENRATVHSVFHIMENTDPTEKLKAMGTYSDKYNKEGDTWKLTHRLIKWKLVEE